jgi:hypothetical protein
MCCACGQGRKKRDLISSAKHVSFVCLFHGFFPLFHLEIKRKVVLEPLLRIGKPFRFKEWAYRLAAVGGLEGRVVLLIAVWYGVSAANNILNKVFLVKESDLHLSSLALMFAQTVIALLCAVVCFLLKVDRFSRIPPKQVVRSIIPLAVGFIITVVLTYVALENISVSLSSTIKVTSPLSLSCEISFISNIVSDCRVLLRCST